MDKPLKNMELEEVRRMCMYQRTCWGCPLHMPVGGCAVCTDPEKWCPADWDLREKEERHG